MTDVPARKKGLSRRRFIRICAAAVAGSALPASALGAAPSLHRWKGIALGAAAEINLLHRDRTEALQLFQMVEGEIRRLEAVFSLYRADSELVRLNNDGFLKAPSHEMVELLGLSRRIHDVTAGAFDPTVQSLWALHAAASAAGQTVDPANVEAVLARTRLAQVRFDAREIRYARDGIAMTLNGIAQGYITDRVAELLRARGCRDVVVDLGEVSLNGTGPDRSLRGGPGWTVTLQPDPDRPAAKTEIHVKDAAVASSARFGTTLDNGNTVSHILDPRTGHPVDGDLVAASVVAPTAALADGLSTAALVCGEKTLTAALSEYPAARAFSVHADGSTTWI